VPRALSLVIPEGLVVFAAALLALFGGRLPGFAQVAEWLPAIFLLVGVGLAWRFGRGRLFAALVIISLLWGWVVAGAPWEFRPVLAVALALVLLAVGWSPERGMRGVYIVALALAVIFIGVGSVLLTQGYPGYAPGPSAGPLHWTGLPEWGGWALVTAVLGLLAAGLVRGDGVAQGALWGTVAGWGALVIEGRPGGLVLVSGAAAAVVTGTLESIYSAAYRDALTGLPSRRALDETLDALPTGAIVAMVDVDHFKKFNDTHGHETGDQVLRMVAWRLAEVPDAKAFRYGGEEFTIVFTGLPVSEVMTKLERARAAVAGSKFMLRSGDRPKGKEGRTKRGRLEGRHGLSVTISIGVAVRKGNEIPASLIKRADDALYAAKDAGRDRVVASGG